MRNFIWFSDETCALPLANGGPDLMCLAYMPSWYHAGGECKDFVYGGCGGNANRFASKEKCEEFCITKTA